MQREEGILAIEEEGLLQSGECSYNGFASISGLDKRVFLLQGGVDRARKNRVQESEMNRRGTIGQKVDRWGI